MYEEFHGTLLSEYYPKWIEEGTMQRDTLQKKIKENLLKHRCEHISYSYK